MINLKILELVSIINDSQRTLIHIRLITENETELLWQIDNITATNIMNIFECDGYHKYRISLQSTSAITKDLFISSLTKTYRDISEPLFFNCSKEYKHCLDSIKNSQTIDELTSLPFISKLPDYNESTIPIHNFSNTFIMKKRLMTNFGWLFVCLTIIVLFSLYPENKTTIKSPVVLASPPEITTASIKTAIVKDVIVTTTATLTEDTTPPSLPFITIDDSLIYSIPEGYVALTFDDGPSKYTMGITDILKTNNVGGTFFFLGSNAQKYPESVRYVMDNGFSIGNHSMKHSDMTKLSIEEQQYELLHSAKVIEDITEEKIKLFRPPYGALNEQVTEVIQAHQFNIIQWNKDPKDWKTKDPDQIIKYIRGINASGSIIILHESQTVIDALPKLIEILQEQNLHIVNLQ